MLTYVLYPIQNSLQTENKRYIGEEGGENHPRPGQSVEEKDGEDNVVGLVSSLQSTVNIPKTLYIVMVAGWSNQEVS